MSREHESGNRNMSREPGSGSPALYQVICLQPWCHLKTSQGQAGHVPEAKSGVVSSRGRSPSGRIFFLTGNPRKSAVQLGAWEPTALGSKSRWGSTFRMYAVLITVGLLCVRHCFWDLHSKAPNTMFVPPCLYHQPQPSLTSSKIDSFVFYLLFISPTPPILGLLINYIIG